MTTIFINGIKIDHDGELTIKIFERGALIAHLTSHGESVKKNNATQEFHGAELHAGGNGKAGGYDIKWGPAMHVEFGGGGGGSAGNV